MCVDRASWLMHTLTTHPHTHTAMRCCLLLPTATSVLWEYRSQSSSAHLIPINITRLASAAKHSSPKVGLASDESTTGYCTGSRCQLCAREPCSRFPPLHVLKSSLLSDVSRHLAGFNMTSNPASPPPVTSPEAQRTSSGRPSLILPRSTGPLAILPNTARAQNTGGP